MMMMMMMMTMINGANLINLLLAGYNVKFFPEKLHFVYVVGFFAYWTTAIYWC